MHEESTKELKEILKLSEGIGSFNTIVVKICLHKSYSLMGDLKLDALLGWKKYLGMILSRSNRFLYLKPTIWAVQVEYRKWVWLSANIV